MNSISQHIDKADSTWVSMIDYLKALAICLVVANHSLTADARESWLFFFIVRMAVPIFVLVSGYNFAISINRMESPWQWYDTKRILGKLRTYLLPMFAVFAIWVTKELLCGRFDVIVFAKAFVLQSYGSGAYYFWIIVQLYLLFPVVYWLTVKPNRGGEILVVLILNVAYEVLLYFLPIPQSVYRVVGFRYITMLALGSIIYNRLNERGGRAFSPILLTVSFVTGCAYIAFFSMNNDNTDIFRYTTWGNTNVLSCLYVAPLFYWVLLLFRDSRLKPLWLHSLVSYIGQSSYYILCTQMVMFWFISRLWVWTDVPLSVSLVGNIILSVVSGLCVHKIVVKITNLRYKKQTLTSFIKTR